MVSLEESIVTAMDGRDTGIFPYLPYILQDFWEIGSSPEEMIRLIEKHSVNYSGLEVLDLGCGKGAVSVRIAEKLKCRCFGFDGLVEFIEEARQKAVEYKVGSLCSFEVADIREKIKELTEFDIIILGAIGQVFGNYYETLVKLKKCLKKDGFIIIDDAYIEDSSTFSHPAILKKGELSDQISRAGMVLIDQLTVTGPGEKEAEHEQEFNYIELRCKELINKYPEKKTLFENYIKQQNEEYDVLETKSVCTTMVIKPFTT